MFHKRVKSYRFTKDWLKLSTNQKELYKQVRDDSRYALFKSWLRLTLDSSFEDIRLIKAVQLGEQWRKVISSISLKTKLPSYADEVMESMKSFALPRNHDGDFFDMYNKTFKEKIILKRKSYIW